MEHVSDTLAGKSGIVLQGNRIEADLIADVLKFRGCASNVFVYHHGGDALKQLDRMDTLDFVILNSASTSLIPAFCEKFPQLVVILVTAADRDSIPQNLCIRKVIQKPFNIETLCSEIAGALKPH